MFSIIMILILQIQKDQGEQKMRMKKTISILDFIAMRRPRTIKLKYICTYINSFTSKI